MTISAALRNGRVQAHNDSLEHTTGNTYLLTLACCLAQASIGYASSIAGLIPQDLAHVNSVRYVYLAGVIAGAVSTAVLSICFGRKGTFAAGVAIAAISGIVQTATSTTAVALFGCLLAGMGCGMIETIAPVWQVEAVATHLRGRLVVLQICAHIGGSALAAWSAWLYGVTEQHEQIWRVLVALQLVLQLPALACLPLLSNTQGMPDTMPKRGAGRNLWRLTLGGLLQLLTGYCGSPTAVASLLVPVLLSIGVSANASTVIGLGCVTLVLCSIFSTWMVDRLGRRGTLQLALAALAILYFLITLLVVAPTTRGLLVTLIVLLFVAAVWAGILFPLPWLYQAEINSAAWRVTGCAIGTVAQILSSDAVVFAQSSVLQSALQDFWRFSLPLTLVNAVCLVVVYLLYPETVRRSLDDIDDYFGSNPSFIARSGRLSTGSDRPFRSEASELQKLPDA